MGSMSGGYYSQQLAGAPFAPTYWARQADVGIAVQAEGEGYTFQGPAGCDASVQLWVETSATETWVRLGGDGSGNVFGLVRWWNTSSVDQGTPGVDENALVLGERVDSVNIYTKSSVLTGSDDLAQLNAIGSYTNDDKISFFSPTNGVNYGLDCNADTNVNGTTEWEEGTFTMQVTFRKSGFEDLTVEYSGNARGDAESDF